MKVAKVSALLFGQLAISGPIASNVDYALIIKAQLEKRQDLGVVPGVPAGLSGFIPIIGNMGILPSVVKGLNSNGSFH